MSQINNALPDEGTDGAPYVSIGNSIDATLEETQKKLADLTSTAERMNTIITESKYSRIRQRVRNHSISLVAVFAVTACLLAANLYLIHSVVEMNKNFSDVAFQIEVRQQRILNQIDYLGGVSPLQPGNRLCMP